MSPSTDRALALTRDLAFVWNPTTTQESSQILALNLSNPTNRHDPLPLGHLVTNGSDDETGLVVINPVSGKVTFWENIDTANALSLLERRRHGLEGSIGSLLSGETIIDITSTEYAGFVLIFSSGRVAQLLLRDAQSRPTINVTFLKNPASNARGFFGSVRNALGVGAWLRDVCAVKTTVPKSRGLTDIIIAAESAKFQFWQLSWAGYPVFQSELDARPFLEAAIGTSLHVDITSQEPEIKLLDIAVPSVTTESSQALTQRGEKGPSSVVALVSVENSREPCFALANMQLASEGTTIQRLIRLQSFPVGFAYPVPKGHGPRLHVPEPSVTAYIVFEQGITLVSLGIDHAQEEANLLSSEGTEPFTPFQDTVSLRQDQKHLRITGAGQGPSHGKQQQSSILVSLKDHGLLRVSANEPKGPRLDSRSKLTARNKMEQAVSFGAQATNPLDLISGIRSKFSIEDIESAAEQISKDIISSDFRHLPPLAVSMERHLETRATLLDNLARHVKQNYSLFSQLTRWKLLWNAEMLAAAQSIWPEYDSSVQTGEAPQVRLLPEIIDCIPEKLKSVPVPEPKDFDSLRHFFLKAIGSMKWLAGWAYKYVFEERDEDLEKTSEFDLWWMVRDALEIVTRCLGTAQRFRRENSWLYGLEGNNVPHDQARYDYQGLPEFWNCHWFTIDATMKLLRNAIDMCEGPTDADVEPLSVAIAELIPKLLEIWTGAFEEDYQWGIAQTDPKIIQNAHDRRKGCVNARTIILSNFPATQLARGFALAEKYRDMRALVNLMSDESSRIMQESSAIQEEKQAARQSRDFRQEMDCDAQLKDNERAIRGVERRLKGYHQRYGLTFGSVWFSKFVNSNRTAQVLDLKDTLGRDLTNWLRTEPKMKNVSWMNDVLSEKDYAKAGQSLMAVSKDEEHIWSKGIQTSLAKLSLLAADEAAREQTRGDAQPAERYPLQEVALRDSRAIGAVQARMDDHLESALDDALDQEGKVELAIDAFGKEKTKDRRALQSILGHNLELILDRDALKAEALVEVLTLMDSHECKDPDRDISGHEFVLALQVLKHAGSSMDAEAFDLLSKTTWRRVFIADQWQKINMTLNKSDDAVTRELESTVLFQTLKQAQKMGEYSALFPPEIPFSLS